MEATALIDYMNRPETMKGPKVRELEGLVAKYPYFGIGQALLAVAYQHEDNPAMSSSCALQQAWCLTAIN